MQIFEFTDYKEYLKEWIRAQPNGGHGLIRKIADHLRVSPTMMSHILNGDKDFSFEAANDLASFLGLDERECDFFLLLLSYAKAGSFSLRERYKAKIKFEQKKSAEVSKRMKPDQTLPEVAKTVFYSDWVYTGVRNMTACESFQNIDAIATHLNFPRAVVHRVLEFLLKNELCIEKDGKVLPGPRQTHVGHASPFVNRHHQNWRLKAFTQMTNAEEKNLFFTSPMSLSYEVAEIIRQRLPAYIEEIVNLVRPAPSETVRCLNIDWFEY